MAGRVRTLRTMVSRLGDVKLQAYWNLRSICPRGAGNGDWKLIRDAIVQRIKEIREDRTKENHYQAAMQFARSVKS